MRRLLLAVFFLLPTHLFASDTYDPATGMVHIPIVSAGIDTYEVAMIHQGSLVFSVISVKPTSITSILPDTFDSETGVLHMPSVIVGADNYEVEMMHQGDLVFKVTKAILVNHNSDAIDLSGDWSGSASSSLFSLQFTIRHNYASKWKCVIWLGNINRKLYRWQWLANCRNKWE